MKRLENYDEAKFVLKKLFIKVNFCDEKVLDKFIADATKNCSHSSISSTSLPTLWYPQNEKMRFIKDIFDQVLTINIKGSNFRNIPENFVISLVKSLTKNEIYFAGDCLDDLRVKHRVMKFIPEELKDIINNTQTEGYIFDEEVSWLLVLTHEDFAFLAGNSRFIECVKVNFPEHQKWEATAPMMG